MHLNYRNVNDALAGLVRVFAEREYRHRAAWKYGEYPSKELLFQAPVVRRPSRNGPVLMLDEPGIVTYTNPRERVLLNPARDANPFSLLYEALWMLAGRNDVAPLAYYTKRFAEFSDDGSTLNGAYGYRWRYARHGVGTRGNAHYGGTIHDRRNEADQLEVIVEHLKADPNSRRAVLAMWNVEDDLLKIGEKKLVHADGGECHGTPLVDRRCPKCGIHPDTQSTEIWTLGSKDVCCNLSVMFSLREADEQKTIGWLGGDGYGKGWTTHPMNYRLDMTVTNRSNDLLWGMLGANYVTFSFLQEYLAARLRCGVGRYHHFTNNLHVYEERGDWKPGALLAAAADGGYRPGGGCKPFSLVSDPDLFEKELRRFVEEFSGKTPVGEHELGYDEPFLRDVAAPLLVAFSCYKAEDFHGAFAAADGCEADDWRTAAEAWLRRRAGKREGAKNVRG